MLGDLLRSRREDIVLATKVGNPLQNVQASGGLSARWISQAAEAALRRLQTDRIDLYWLHLDDEVTPLAETLGAVSRLIAEGKILHWGFSNFRAWKIAEMVRVADEIGCTRPVSAQPYYHMLNRAAEAEYIPACVHFGIGVIPYSPLARGVLTGKYQDGMPEGSRAARADSRILEAEFRPATLAAASRAVSYARDTGRDPVAMALQWVLANTAVRSVLVGPRTLAQMHAYLDSIACTYLPSDEAALSALCAAGQTPGDGAADPRYPYRGRFLRS